MTDPVRMAIVDLKQAIVTNVEMHDAAYSAPTGFKAVPSDIANIGWPYDGSNVTPPTLAPVAPYTPPVISRRQFYQQLVAESLITQSEGLAAMSGTIPSELMTLINALPTAQQFPAQMLVAGASQFEISHPVTQAVAAGFKWSETDLAAFWTSAAAL